MPVSSRSHKVPAVIGLFLLLVQPTNFDAEPDGPKRPGRPDFGLTVIPASGSWVPDFTIVTPTRVPVACDDLLDLGVLASVLGVEETALAPVERSRIWWIEGAAAAQAGTLECAWQTSPDDLVTTADVSVSVLPYAASDFHAYSEHYTAVVEEWLKEYPDQPRIKTGLLGTDSLLSCDYSGPDQDFLSTYQSCEGSVGVSGYWVDFRLSRSQSVDADDAATEDFESTETRGIALGRALSRAISAVGPPLAQKPLRPGTLDAWESCEALGGAGGVQAAADSPTLTLDRVYSGIELYQEDAALPLSPYKTCSWHQSVIPDEYVDVYFCDDCGVPEGWVSPQTMPDQIAFLDVAILPGGDWAWPEMKLDMPPLDAESISALGAKDATAYCGLGYGNWCEINVLIGHSVIYVQFSYDNAEDVDDPTPRAVQIAKYVIDHLRN